MRTKEDVWLQKEFQEAFVANERRERIRSGKVACALVVFLMPVGIILDRYVYPERWADFLLLRLFCSGLAGGLWALHNTPLGIRHYRFLGIPIALLPAFFISWMIRMTEGLESPYYAGLILILLAVNAIVHWSTGESLLAIGMLFLFYLIACIPWNIARDSGIFFNNIYFLVLTGIIVVTGNYLYNQLHFREFVLRFELSQNRQKLEETNQKLVEMDRIKSRFFANISHELRTPLNAVIGFSEVMQQALFGPLGHPKYQEYARDIFASGAYLLEVINDILDMSKIEAGRMSLDAGSVDLADIVEDSMKVVSQAAAERNITLNRHGPQHLLLEADRRALKQVFLNLLSNAVKFTRDGGSVDVHLSRSRGHVKIAIKDTGIGIPEAEIAKLGRPFEQVENQFSKSHQGSGLGLAISRALVELHGGTLRITSREGHGTTVTCTLPTQPVIAEEERRLAATA